MQSSSAIVLRVFSGPHIGAELQLPLGDHIVGCEDSCDIILVDASLLGRHAVLRIVEQAVATNTQGESAETEQKQHFSLSVRPLDGQILVAGELVGPQGMAIAPCTLFEVGTTSLAWNMVGAPWSEMSVAAVLGYGSSAAPATASETGEAGVGAPVSGDAGLSFYDDLDVGVQEDGANKEEADTETLSLRQKAQKVASLPIKTLIAIFLAIICICGVMVSFEGRPPDMTAHAAELEMQLHTLGMTGLTVSNTDEGVVVQGVLDTHAQRTALWHVTSGLLYPVEIVATVREDLLLAVTAAFNSRHMYPEILSLHDVGNPNASATEKDSDVVIQISGYFQDGQVEAWAFQSMHADVPTDFKAERNVRHQEEVKAVLEPALVEAKLGHVRTRFMPGVVQIAGHFDLEQHAALDDVLIAVQDTLGVPVRFEVYAELPKSIQVAAATNTSDARALEDAHKEAKKESKLTGGLSGDVDDEPIQPLGTLKVVSVTLSPLCFFATDDGQRFFEGAVLPSGYSVEQITMDALTLKKNGAEIVHNLRGNHD